MDAALAELRKLVDDQRALNAKLSQQVDAQGKEIEALRSRLDEARTLALSASNEMAALRHAPPATTVSQALQAREAALEQAAKHLPELPEKVVTSGEFPGSIAIPGTDTAFRIGGQARATFIRTLAPLGDDDRFTTSSIPVGDERAGDGPRTKYIATPTRLSLDLRTPTPLGPVRTFVETDFGASGSTARLRHAYIQTDRWIFGQTWSTFSDPEIEPSDIDFEGESALSRFRQAQARYTRPLSEGVQVAFAVENPAPDLTGAQGVNLTPDFVTRLRWDASEDRGGMLAQPAHLQGAILVRTLRGQLVNQPDVALSTGGFGVTWTGLVVSPWARKDLIKFATNDGWGIGRYITDLGALGGQDAVLDTSTNTLRALPVTSVYIGYEHQWHPSFVSSFTYDFVNVFNLGIQPGDALHRTQRGMASITWNPFSRADVVLEFLGGTRLNKDGQHGNSSQIQAGWRVRF